MKLKNLPLGNYAKTGTNYIALIDGNGVTCDNCGRLIANMVYVKHDSGKSFTIGQDCAKTLFDEKTNKEIDSAIKEEKHRKENELKQAQQQKRRDAIAELTKLSWEAGIKSENCNEQWARDKYNDILTALEEKHGFYISYKR